MRLRPVTLLVGRNGSGKSNFLDAIRFVTDGLQSSLDHAIRDRGGIDEVRRRSTGHPHNFAVCLDLNLPDDRVASYGFEIGSRRDGGFSVRQERLTIRNPAGTQVVAEYQVKDGAVSTSTESHLPQPAPDRLFLVAASHLQAFRAVLDALASIGFYNLNPNAMRELQSPDAGQILRRDGSNIASVVGTLQESEPSVLSRVNDYLASIVPGIEGVERKPLGPKETLEFRQQVRGSAHPWKFYANSMSDGTLRALGALVAIMQLVASKRRALLVGIEEPETALHPAAAGALMDALREACAATQVIVTSHSLDLLDQIDLERDGLLVVVSNAGTTEVACVDSASRKAIQEHLYTPGELLRMDQLQPDPVDLKRQHQGRLFDEGDAA